MGSTAVGNIASGIKYPVVSVRAANPWNPPKPAKPTPDKKHNLYILIAAPSTAQRQLFIVRPLSLLLPGSFSRTHIPAPCVAKLDRIPFIVRLDLD